ncbi:hypothetical protein Salat_0806100 [Sesamum alatum]|uniref:C2 domain-containing protein n=1 Tax=Sesamum alatum TaxID=300844 RepID=A0AAE1YTY9_9LAMI|nr:hypothetical protein Salat_0806100 [Sesamum alatum]
MPRDLAVGDPNTIVDQLGWVKPRGYRGREARRRTTTPSVTERRRRLLVSSTDFRRFLGMRVGVVEEVRRSEDLQQMGKLRVEVCLVSARGLRRTSSLWRLQWFAVGWIDPNDKYCTTIDTNPVWKTKFSMSIDASDSSFQDLALHVEVCSRELLFLGERLLGTATVVLKELLDKYYSKSEVLGHVEEVGSFRLRKKNSDKTRGFVDVSIRISEENEEDGTGGENKFDTINHRGTTEPATKYGSLQSHRQHMPLSTLQQPGNYRYLPTPPNYSHQASLGAPNYTPGTGGGPIYHRTRTPPLLPPPYNVGYVPTFLPRTDYLTQSIVAPPGHRPRPGFVTGLGAEALAVGAMIFGDDFLAGFEFSSHLGDAGVTISTDHPL